jgi:hypothetical protein
MRLLFVDSDPASARALHGEFLDYRGLNWSLTHCRDPQAAIQQMELDQFQSLLLRTHSKIDQTIFELSELLQAASCPPVLTVAEDLSPDQQMQIVAAGSDDCVNRCENNGPAIMRRLRMVELRKSVWSEQASQVVDNHLPDLVDLFETGKEQTEVRSPGAAVPKQVRVAHVCYGTSLLDGSLRAMLETDGEEIKSQLFEHLEDLIKILVDHPHTFDVLLIEQSVFEEANVASLTKLNAFLPLVPGIVLTLEKSDFSALSYLKRGFFDCLSASHATATSMIITIRKAVALRRRALLELLSSQQVGPTVNDRRASVRNAQNRRRHVRFFTERSLVAIPILPNGAPDIAGRCNATTVDVSLGGMGVKIPDREQLPSRNWILGIDQPNGTTGYIHAYLRRVAYHGGELQAGLIFQCDTDDLFNLENLWPTIDSQSKRLETRLGSSALDQWVELGVLEKQLVRRARTCPDCDAICSVGTGCSQCGAFNLQYHDLIHHFACAHVARAAKFEKEGTISCPKCLRANLVVGADFELIRSQYVCAECGHQSDVTAQVGNCLNCQLRFPLELGKEVDIYGYDVERMDILAVVDSAR